MSDDADSGLPVKPKKRHMTFKGVAKLVSTTQQLRKRYKDLKVLQDEMNEDTEKDEVIKPFASKKSPASRMKLAKNVVQAATRMSLGARKNDVEENKLVHANTAMLRMREDMEDDDVFEGSEEKGADHDIETRVPMTLEEQEEELNEYWQNFTLSAPEQGELDKFEPPVTSDIVEEYATESKEQSVVIGKVPKEAILEQKEALKKKLYEERTAVVDNMKKKERDVVWREHLATQRVKTLEEHAKERIRNEQEKLSEQYATREKLLNQEFRRGREALESALHRQQSSLGEVFGKLDNTTQESMSRKMYVKSVHMPQPVEVRCHLLRSLNVKLPKGAYTMMLTTYDELGGSPLCWTNLGVYGIGPDFPSMTRALKHHGRYFDRNLKFEDSMFTLCPPRNDCYPGYVFVFELFELKSRTNPYDRPVAWSAVPMTNEEGNITEGRMKLPFLKGQHSPLVHKFQQMENSIANNLDNWLCNGYFEFRVFSLAELGMVAKDVIRLNRYVNFDFLNKRLKLQNGKGEYSHTFGVKQDEDDLDLIAIDHGLLKVRDKDKQMSSKREELLNNYHPQSMVGQRDYKAAANMIAKDPNASMNQEHLERIMSGEDPMQPHLQSYRHRQDGFASYSKKVDEIEEVKVAASFGGIMKTAYDKFVAACTGTEYVPSRTSYGASRKLLDTKRSNKIRDTLLKSSKKFDHDHEDGDNTLLDDEYFGDVVASNSSRKIMMADEENAITRHRKQDEEDAGLGLSKKDDIYSAIGNTLYKTGDKLKKTMKRVLTSATGPSIKRSADGSVKFSDIVEYDDGMDSDGFKVGDDSDDEKEAGVNNGVKPRSSADLDDRFYEEGDEITAMEVFERGLETEDSGPAIGLHPEQSGKLVGVETVASGEDRWFAASGLERKVIRRLQSDGPRFDSEGVNEQEYGKEIMPVSTDNDDDNKDQDGKAWIQAAVKAKRDDWKHLDRPEDMDLYTMAVARAPEQRKKLLPDALALSKYRFILTEAFGDLTKSKWGSFPFFMTMFSALASFWLRIYIHYVGQYIYLTSTGSPIFGFKLYAFQILFKYQSSSLSQSNEVGLVFMGHIFVMLFFTFFAGSSYAYYKFADRIPDGISKFVSIFGVMTVLDPYIHLIMELAHKNFDCRNLYDSCKANYQDSSCKCMYGDFTKLWNRFMTDEGSGVTGLLITVIIYLSMTALAGVIYYEYLLNVHRAGRILDLWRRVHADAHEFFLPNDFEISKSQLKNICIKADNWRGAGGETRKLSVSKFTETDDDDPEFFATTTLYVIHEVDFGGGATKVYRQFLQVPEGYITEVFEEFTNNNRAKQKLKDETDMNFENGEDASLRTRRGLFSGLERA